MDLHPVRISSPLEYPLGRSLMSLPSLLINNVGSTVPLENFWESRNEESKSYQARRSCSTHKGLSSACTHG
nr:hypothetical protein [Tanacetum cinerariifolium]